METPIGNQPDYLAKDSSTTSAWITLHRRQQSNWTNPWNSSGIWTIGVPAMDQKPEQGYKRKKLSLRDISLTVQTNGLLPKDYYGFMEHSPGPCQPGHDSTGWTWGSLPHCYLELSQQMISILMCSYRRWEHPKDLVTQMEHPQEYYFIPALDFLSDALDIPHGVRLFQKGHFAFPADPPLDSLSVVLASDYSTLPDSNNPGLSSRALTSVPSCASACLLFLDMRLPLELGPRVGSVLAGG
ncbi:hypothetical protein F5Y05DRAFT_286481 [Hypoxylon sp. FL0543]|nr:hypothetical protein F5Y05DRAFT_286481 [Hypoxylon sp. FL0543]